MEKIKLYMSPFDKEPTNSDIEKVILDGIYSVAKIRRKEDSKEFGCYCRNGKLRINQKGDNAYLISHSDCEEIKLNMVDDSIFDVLEIVFDDETDEK